MLRATAGFLGGGASGFGGLVGQPAGLRQFLGGVLDQLLGAFTARFGVALSFLHFFVDFRLDLSALLLGIRLGSAALALDECLGRLLGFGEALLDHPGRLPIGVPQARAAVLADIPSVLGTFLGFVGGLSGALLRFPRALARLLGAAHPDVDGISAKRSRVDDRRLHLPALIARVRGGGFSGGSDCVCRLQNA